MTVRLSAFPGESLAVHGRSGQYGGTDAESRVPRAARGLRSRALPGGSRPAGERGA